MGGNGELNCLSVCEWVSGHCMSGFGQISIFGLKSILFFIDFSVLSLHLSVILFLLLLLRSEWPKCFIIMYCAQNTFNRKISVSIARAHSFRFSFHRWNTFLPSSHSLGVSFKRKEKNKRNLVNREHSCRHRISIGGGDGRPKKYRRIKSIRLCSIVVVGLLDMVSGNGASAIPAGCLHYTDSGLFHFFEWRAHAPSTENRCKYSFRFFSLATFAHNL